MAAPRQDRWSISMVLAHLADVEVKGFLSRFRDIVEQENPFLPAYDQLAFFTGRNKFDGRAELDRFTHLRADSLAWFKAAPADSEFVFHGFPPLLAPGFWLLIRTSATKS